MRTLNILLGIITASWAVNLYLNILPEGTGRMVVILPMGMTILLMYFLYGKSHYNSTVYHLIERIRLPFSISLIFLYLFMLLFGTMSSFSVFIIQPLLMFLAFYLSVNLQKNNFNLNTSAISGLEESMSSLFNFMFTISNAIQDNVDIDDVLQNVVKSSINDCNASGGAILLADEYDDVLKVRAVGGIFPPPYKISSMIKSKIEAMEENFRLTHIKLGETILGEAARDGKPVFIRDASADSRLINNQNQDVQLINSMIIFPLINADRILGVLALVQSDKRKPFTDNDFNRLKTFSDYTAITLNNLFQYVQIMEKQELEKEFGIAADIQKELLPSKMPDLKYVNLAPFSKPAKGISGDYYDMLQLPGDRLALVICDVAGKGLPAALVMVMIKTIVNLVAPMANNSATVLSWINKGIAGKVSLDRYATMSYMIYHLKTGKLQYSNAAHHPLLYYSSREQRLSTLDTEGIPIGLEANAIYGMKEITLEKDDIILTYTDGIIEALNYSGKQFGFKSLVKCIHQTTEYSSRQIVRHIQKVLANFEENAKQHDDQTLMVMKVLTKDEG